MGRPGPRCRILGRLLLPPGKHTQAGASPRPTPTDGSSSLRRGTPPAPRTHRRATRRLSRAAGLELSCFNKTSDLQTKTIWPHSPLTARLKGLKVKVKAGWTDRRGIPLLWQPSNPERGPLSFGWKPCKKR